MSSDHQRPRQPQSRGHRNTWSNAPLVSTSFIASWRGQVLICTVCLAFGAIYFFVRRAVTPIIQRRREAISEARQAELMTLEAESKKKESSETPANVEKSGSKDIKGKDKRKDGRKRKVSSALRLSVVPPGSENGLQVSGGGSTAGSGQSQAGPSSRESSPFAQHLNLPTPKSTRKSDETLIPRDRSVSNSHATSSPSPSPTPIIRIRQPTAEEVVRLPGTRSNASLGNAVAASSGSERRGAVSQSLWDRDAISPRSETRPTPSSKGFSKKQYNQFQINAASVDPELIPLPSSPTDEAISSRDPAAPACYPEAESDSTTTHSSSSPQSVIEELDQTLITNSSSKSRSKLPAVSSGGFSTMPDASYLPPKLVSPALQKRKKKKDRSPDLFDNNPSSHSHQSDQTRVCSSSNTATTHYQSSDDLSRYSQPTSVTTESTTPNSPSTKHSKPPLDTPLVLRPSFRGHSRKSSLKLIRPPPNPTAEQLDAYCTERDQVVDSLRAELGLAKAQEAKAKDDALKARLAQERAQKDTDHLAKQFTSFKKEHKKLVTQLAQDYLETYHDMLNLHRIALDNYARGMQFPMPEDNNNGIVGMIETPPMPQMAPSFTELFNNMAINMNGPPQMFGPLPPAMNGPAPHQQMGPSRHPQSPYGPGTPGMSMGFSPPSSMPTGMGPMTPSHPSWQSRSASPAFTGQPSPGPYQNGFSHHHHQGFPAPPPMLSPHPHSPLPNQMGHPAHQDGFMSPGPPMNPNAYVGPISPMNSAPMMMGPGSGLHYLPPMPSPQFVGPNPGMPPHPGMLHPNHIFMNGLPNGHMPPHNGLRRISGASSSADVFAGPLTPGIPYAVTSPLPVQMGLGHSSDIEGQRMRSGSSSDMSAERRVSIQDTVMRKKPIHGNDDSEPMSAECSSTLVETDESKVNCGLGVGLVEDTPAPDTDVAADTPSPASSKHRKFSLSPTPDLHRVLSRGSGSSLSAPSSPTLPTSRDTSVSEAHHAVIQKHHDSIESGQHVVIDEKKPRTLSTSISDGLLRPRSFASSLDAEALSDEDGPAQNGRSDSPGKNNTDPDGLDSSSPEMGHTPYFPSLAWSKEENDERRMQYDAEQEARQMERREKRAAARSIQTSAVEI